ncbi:PAS domain-containing protein [Pararhodobacter sp. SW119]|uniref:PAS-domain containing protein n=1 Tax=Pararhodobacter sp. SW119 TaxID=2780075 RepID=UPI001ADF0673|nr:PAS domain-containing protein [Pararhodobacter sp. SW119]
MDSSLTSALVVLATSAATALAVVLIAAGLLKMPSRVPQAKLGGNRLDAVFLFSDRVLVDANDRGEALLSSLAGTAGDIPGEGVAWARLSRYLAAGFPDLAERLATLAQRRRLELTAKDGSGLSLLAEWLDGTARLTLADTAAEEGGVMLDRLSHRALEEELAVLRGVSDLSPIPTWRENAQGQVIWANGAYLHQLIEAGYGGAISWPLPSLFPGSEAGRVERVSLALPGGRVAWFDLQREADEKGQLVFAVPADAAHLAESARQSFIQTLTKTFATLPIGLAVFDRHRRLQLFNPALSQLTGLEPEFLLSRPGMEGFLNRMRGKRILPEPRDYSSWARRLTDCESSGEPREFEETWSLPSGQTFRVSVRPHPDGALAFMLEDISSEVYLSRNFRAELETGQAALNLLEAAVAVFSANGQLVLTNAAFGRLWGQKIEESMAVVTLREALGAWRLQCEDSDLWAGVAALARPQTDQGVVAGVVRLKVGRQMMLRARRATNSALLVVFEPLAELAALDSAEARAPVTHQNRPPAASAGKGRLSSKQTSPAPSAPQHAGV